MYNGTTRRRQTEKRREEIFETIMSENLSPN
jgi:hypothetical protein